MPAPSTPSRAFPWSILHEALLQLALAAIPIGATIIHPALGGAAALTTVAGIIHLESRNFQ